MRLTFPKSDVLAGRGTFKAILEHGARAWQGPIGIAYAPNDVARWRMGISIGRAVGTAAVRNRIKRMLREAFRTSRGTWPGSGGDLVILTKPHAPLSLTAYIDTFNICVPRAVEKLRIKQTQAKP